MSASQVTPIPVPAPVPLITLLRQVSTPKSVAPNDLKSSDLNPPNSNSHSNSASDQLRQSVKSRLGWLKQQHQTIINQQTNSTASPTPTPIPTATADSTDSESGVRFSIPALIRRLSDDVRVARAALSHSIAADADTVSGGDDKSAAGDGDASVLGGGDTYSYETDAYSVRKQSSNHDAQRFRRDRVCLTHRIDASAFL